MDNMDKLCIVCGVHNGQGVSIWGQFICHRCEMEMVNTEVDDQKYEFFIKQLRKIWLKKNA